MAFKNKSMTIGAAIFCLGTLVPAVTGAYAISPMEIYRQARQQNEFFLQKLSRYRNAFDMQDKDGNTAYCIALRYNDVSAQEILEKYGADTGHSCVESIEREKEEKARRAERNAAAKRRRFRSSEGVFADSGNNYLWWGLGALAVGGGVAALAGGGGSGSSGEIHGPSGTYGKVYLGTGEPSGSLTKVDANEFRTAEYNRSNFLEGINAAEAYSYMYSKDDRGLLYSHQANSDEALKKVKVGVIDTGVFHNRDLDGKIVGSYDINSYNTAGDVRGKIAGNMHYYIFSKDGSYYFLQVDTSDMSATVGNGKRGPALTPSELDNILAQVGLTQGDFEVMNGGGGSNPGTSLMGKFDPDDINTWWEVATNLSHGTHVAGIIAGNKKDMGSHGVAFENGEIVAASWDMGTDISATVKDMVDKGVEVFNNSWGYNAVDGWNAGNAEELANTSDAEAYAYAAKNGAVWVQATGNDGYHDAAIHAGLGNVDLSQYGYDGPGEYEAPFLAVAALDYSTKDASAPSGYLAGYSNWCGSASGYCLAAPGTDVESTGAVTEGFMDESGTSMATPAVAGSVALLMGYYPWLSAQNVAYILLETANDQGEYADGAKYGQGALDLEAAVTTPIDGLRLASSSSFNSLTPVGISKLSLSSSMQNKILKALPKTVTAFDALNRPFEYSTENLVNTTHASNANLRNAVSRLAMGGAKKTVKDERTGFAFTTSESMDNGGRAGLATMEVVNETDSGSTRFYYAENSKYDTPESVLAPTSNPYLAMNEAYGAENMLKLSDTSRLKLSLQTGENGLYERDYEQDNHSFTERSYAFSGEYSFNMTDYLEIATLGGMLMENDALLGMNGTGGFGIKDSSTYYMGLRAALNLTPNLSLVAAYYRGYTQGADTPMLAISDLQTESFMLAGEYRLNATDKVGISLSSPLSVVKGRASLLYANGRDNNSDTIYLNKLTTSLTPEAKEYDLGLYYQGQPKEDLSLTGKVQARFNADGEKGVTDYIGIVGVQSAF